MSDHRKQHYLSKFYLEGFTFKKRIKKGITSNVLWLYDKEKKELIEKSPSSVCWELYYYSFLNNEGKLDHTIEESFSYLEYQMKLLIDKITHNIFNIDKHKPSHLTSDDVNILLNFIFLNMKKTPKLIDDLKNKVEISSKYIESQLPVILTDSYKKKSVLKLMLDIGSQYTTDFIKLLSNRNIYIFYLKDNDYSILTTDNPVVRFNKDKPDGLKYYDTELYFPLRNNCLITIRDKGNLINYIEI